MDPQLLLSLAADLERPPTQLEVETELATPGNKDGPGHRRPEGHFQMQEREIEASQLRGASCTTSRIA